MTQKWKVTALIAVTTLCLAVSPAMAETTTDGTNTFALAAKSNTNRATAGIFSTDVDNFVSVNNYGSLNLANAFVFAGLAQNNLQLGYARKIGGLYLGAYYAGDALNQTTGLKSTTAVATTKTVTNGVVSSTSTTTTTTLTTDDPAVTDNYAEVLVGIIGMGFKLGFDEELTAKTGDGTTVTSGTALSTVVTDTADNSTTSTKYSNTSSLVGYMTPSLQWGMNLGLGDLTLKPNAKVALRLQQNSQAYTKDTTKSVAGSTPYGFVTENKVYKNEGSYLAPAANLAAKLYFPKNDGAQSIVGLAYDLDLPLYGDGTKTTTTTKQTTLNLGSRVDSEDKTVATTAISEITNTVTPSFTYTRAFGDAVSVGFNTSAAVQFYNQASTPTTVQTTVTTTDSYSQSPATDTVTTVVKTTNGYTTTTATLTVTPAINVGFTYNVVPGKFVLNAGYAVTAPKFTNSVVTTTATKPTGVTTSTVTKTNGVTTTDTVTTPIDSSYTNNESQVTTTTWGQLSTALTFGTRFNFTDQFGLDAYTSLSTNGTASILGATSGIVYKVYNLAFTVKY